MKAIPTLFIRVHPLAPISASSVMTSTYTVKQLIKKEARDWAEGINGNRFDSDRPPPPKQFWLGLERYRMNLRLERSSKHRLKR